MGIIVNNNLAAANTARNLSNTYNKLGTSIQRMSTGLRVNNAADDAAGLAIREMMRADITATQQGIRNAADGISLIQTADGSLGVIDEKLTRMKELAEQAATGTYTTVQRDIINSEYQAMAAEIDRIANATEFNGIKLLDGSVSNQHGGQGIKIHFGTGNDAAEDYYFVSIGDARATSSTGLRVGGDAKNDIWGQGGSASGELAGPGCCTNGFDSLNGNAGFISGQSFSYGYNWDWMEDTDESLLGGKYLAGRYTVGSSDSLQDLVLKVNAGTQSRVGLRIDGGALNSAVGLDNGTVAVCIGNETYYWGDTEEVEGNEVTKMKSTYSAKADYYQNANGKLNTVDRAAASAFALAQASAEVTIDGDFNAALGAEALNAAMDKRFSHSIIDGNDSMGLNNGHNPEFDPNADAIQAAKNRDAPLNAAIETKQKEFDTAKGAYETAYAGATKGLTSEEKAAVDEFLKARSDSNLVGNTIGEDNTNLAARPDTLKGDLSGNAQTAVDKITASQDAMFTAQKGLDDAKAAKDAEDVAMQNLKAANVLVREKQDALNKAGNKAAPDVSAQKTAVGAAKTGAAGNIDTVKGAAGSKYGTIADDTYATATSGTTAAGKKALVDAYLTKVQEVAKGDASAAALTALDEKLVWSAASTTGATNLASGSTEAASAAISTTFVKEIAAAKMAGYAERAEAAVTAAETAMTDDAGTAFNELVAAVKGDNDIFAADTTTTSNTVAHKQGQIETYLNAVADDVKNGVAGTDDATANLDDVDFTFGDGQAATGADTVKFKDSDLGKALIAAAEAYGTAQKAAAAPDPKEVAKAELDEAQAAQTKAKEALAAEQNAATNAQAAFDTASAAVADAKTKSGTYGALSADDKKAVDAWLSAVAADKANGTNTAADLDGKISNAIAASATAIPPVIAATSGASFSAVFSSAAAATEKSAYNTAYDAAIVSSAYDGADAAAKQAMADDVKAYLDAVAAGDTAAAATAGAKQVKLSGGTSAAISALAADANDGGVIKAAKDAADVYVKAKANDLQTKAEAKGDAQKALDDAKKEQAAKTGIGEAVSDYRDKHGMKTTNEIADELTKATASAIVAWEKDQTSAGVAVKAGMGADGTTQLYRKSDGSTTTTEADAVKGLGTKAITQSKENYVNAQVKDLIDKYTTLETGVYVDNAKNATDDEVLYDQAKKAGWHEATVNIGADLSAFVQNQVTPGGQPSDADKLANDINKTITKSIKNQTDGGTLYISKAFEATDLAPGNVVQEDQLKEEDVDTRSYVEREQGLVDSGNQKIKVAGNGEGSNKYTADALAQAINENEKSSYWAMTQTVKNKLGQDESMVYVFNKEGGDNNSTLACEQAGKENPASENAAKAIDFQNMETDEFHEAGTKMSLGGEHWATMTPQQTKSNKGHEVWNVTLNGRDVGKERDLWISNQGEINMPGIDESAIAGMTRDGFHEIQNAANAEWAGADVRTQSAAQEALAALDNAIVNKDKIRADLGALQNRLENTMTNLEIQSENLQASESRISDVDTAKEMTEFTKNNVLTQAGVSMLSQANSLSQLALSLMR